MTDEETLEAFRLADSFLPVGTFTASFGLEQFLQAGRVEDAGDLRALLETYLRRQMGCADLIALRAAHAAARRDDLADVRAADRLLTAVTLAAEFRESAEKSGSQLLSLQRELRSDDLLERFGRAVDAGESPGNYAVVLGLTTGRAGIDERVACLLCCHGFLTGLLGVAQRLLPLGHTEAQRLLDDLRPVVVETVDDSAGGSLDDMTPFAPLLDVLAAEHERADRRLFAS